MRVSLCVRANRQRPRSEWSASRRRGSRGQLRTGRSARQAGRRGMKRRQRGSCNVSLSKCTLSLSCCVGDDKCSLQQIGEWTGRPVPDGADRGRLLTPALAHVLMHVTHSPRACFLLGAEVFRETLRRAPFITANAHRHPPHRPLPHGRLQEQETCSCDSRSSASRRPSRRRSLTRRSFSRARRRRAPTKVRNTSTTFRPRCPEVTAAAATMTTGASKRRSSMRSRCCRAG